MKKMTVMLLALLLCFSVPDWGEELSGLSALTGTDGTALTLVHVIRAGEEETERDRAVLKALTKMYPDALTCRTEETDAAPCALIVDAAGQILFFQTAPLPGAEVLAALIDGLLGGAEQMYLYSVLVLDQNGDGVAGAYLNFCTDESCQLVTTDEIGAAALTGDAPQDYHVQLLRLPAGYQALPGTEATVGAGLGWTVMTVEKE